MLDKFSKEYNKQFLMDSLESAENFSLFSQNNIRYSEKMHNRFPTEILKKGW